MWVIIAMYLIFPLQLAKSFSLAGWDNYLFALIEQQECIRWRSVVQLKINNHVAHIPGHLLAAMSTVITDTARLVCGRVCVTLRCPSVCLFVRLFVPLIDHCTLLRRVCCCGPGGQEMWIDWLLRGGRSAANVSRVTLSAEHGQSYASMLLPLIMS